MAWTREHRSLNVPHHKSNRRMCMGDALCVFKSPPNQYSLPVGPGGWRGRAVWSVPWRERENINNGAQAISYLLFVRSLPIIALSLCQLSTHMVPSAQARLSVFTSAAPISAAELCDVSELIVNLWSKGLFQKAIHISEILQNI